jgi:uncharacterized protein (DUF305 family)
MSEKYLYGVIGFLLGVVLTWTLASTAVNGRNLGMMNMMGMRSTSIVNSDNMDQHFIEQMIPHHETAIQMAEIALTKAEHQEIKTLSNNIKSSQSREIEFMEKWYKEWFGKEYSFIPVASAHSEGVMGVKMGMGMGMMGNDTDLERLKNAKPFDKAFIEEMIPHHQMAVMMAQMLQTTTQRQDMKSLAHDIIEAQTAEIEQMRKWYSEWYR